jgi:hypothetical protein
MLLEYPLLEDEMELIRQHSLDSGTRKPVIAGHFDVSDAMTVLADRNQVIAQFWLLTGFVGVCHG